MEGAMGGQVSALPEGDVGKVLRDMTDGSNIDKTCVHIQSNNIEFGTSVKL